MRTVDADHGLPRFRLIERVAHGNFCDVWRGSPEAAIAGDAPVAVKVATSETGARLLRAEAEATAALADPRIAPVIACAAEPVPHLVRPWYEETLRDRPSVGALLGAIDTVARIHARGFSHGDLKPDNVFLDGDRPVLADFGLARERQAARRAARLGHSLATERGGITGGTLAYMAPEIAKGGEPSAAGDVYALGVMLHEVLLGRRPDRAADPDEMRRLLPAGAFDVLARALALDPGDRYPDAAALRAALAPLERRLTAPGIEDVARVAGRGALRGLAAFFVALRCAAVATLLASYAALVYATIFVSPWFLPLLVCAALLHSVIRWEGPETAGEAAARAKGLVVDRRR